MTSKEIFKTTRRTTELGGSTYVSLPIEWCKKLNIEPMQTLELILIEGKHGLFIAVIPNNREILQASTEV